VTGPADGPTIVFIHGTRLNRVAWSQVTPHLLEEFRCVALDLPGHGPGDPPWTTLDAAADHVVEVAREVAQRQPVVVVGLSLGGYVAIEAAARHPGAVSGLVLSGCSTDPLGWRGWAFRAYGGLLRRTPSRLLRVVSDLAFRAAYGHELTARIRAGGDAIVGAPAAVHSLVGRRFSERLRGFDGPFLVVNGSADLLFRPGAQRWIGDRPMTRYALIRGAGHLANLDRAAAFAGLVRAFASGVEAREAGDPGLY
jgi:pimeloyl-ACP methyl ester carboxylesterase